MGEPEIFDLRGLQCPLPVLKTRHRMRPLAAGTRVVVLSDDPLAAIDIPHFCKEHGQALEAQETLEDGVHRFTIERREGKL